jgi:hypothetical protein
LPEAFVLFDYQEKLWHSHLQTLFGGQSGLWQFLSGQRDDSGTAIAYTGAVFAGSRMQILLVFSQN